MKKHLAIFSNKESIEAIFQGDKTVEIRLTKEKIAPFGVVNRHDEVLLKLAGGEILGKAMIDNVLYYDNLDGQAIGQLRKEYGTDMAVGDDFWRQKADCRCATVIFWKKAQRFLAPLRDKKKVGDRRGWVMMGS